MPRYTYNGVSVTASRRQPSSRSDKKYMRTVTQDGRDYLVHYGDPTLEMQRDNPERRRNFLARHNCSSKRNPRAAGFWACYDWANTNEKERIMPDEKIIAVDPRTHNAVVEKGDGYYEDKGDDYATMKSDTGMGIPLYGVTSFAELEELQESSMATEKARALGDFFQLIAGNILRDDEIGEKSAALDALVKEYAERLTKMRPGQVRKEKDAANGLTVWKEANGRYRWLAIYSNRFRDQDTPPEIISEKSHKTFVEMADRGIVPMPELWHWHVPGTRWGKADWVAYADGFALAAGTVDKGKEAEAERIANSPVPIKVSHGMPERFIQRNKEDRSVIDFHITTEISDLPSPAAANPLTGFHLFKEGIPVLPSEKKQYLKEVAGLSDDAIAEIERGLASWSKEAQAAGLEFKEAEPPTAEKPAVAEDLVAVKEEASPVTGVTREEVADALAGVVNAFTEQLTALTTSLTALTAEVKELKQADDVKIAEKAASTPPASLQALVAQRIIGNEAARIDGRSTLAKDRPQEAQVLAKAGPTPFEAINALVAMSRQQGKEE